MERDVKRLKGAVESKGLEGKIDPVLFAGDA
jgi:hypothetical protein